MGLDMGMAGSIHNRASTGPTRVPDWRHRQWRGAPSIAGGQDWASYSLSQARPQRHRADPRVERSIGGGELQSARWTRSTAAAADQASTAIAPSAIRPERCDARRWRAGSREPPADDRRGRRPSRTQRIPPEAHCAARRRRAVGTGRFESSGGGYHRVQRTSGCARNAAWTSSYFSREGHMKLAVTET